MARIPFISYREPDDKNVLRYYILQKDHPHNVGEIFTHPKHEALVQSVVPGYNLYIVWHSTLRGNFVAAYPDYKKDLQFAFNSMASWFLSERILKDEKRYAKFKIK